ncbi:MAG TPA: hypothetical protein VG944_23910, partial [Fimbriimonas sp.]|nr:hypothetical protein [Fimbriimonas sp.]
MSGMTEGRLALLRVIPGPTSVGPTLRNFINGGDGIVTSLDDAMLMALRDEIEEDSDVEVVPFGALVRRALEAAGEQALPLASKDQYESALGQAARALSDESPFRRAARFPGIRQALASTLNELAEWGYDLRETGQLSDDLKAKALDLAELHEETEKLLGAIGRELHAKQLKNCLEAISDPESRPSRIMVFIQSEAPPLK